MRVLRCERPGQGHSCDFELAYPCCNCLCDSCAGAADYQWLGELRAQVRQAEAMLQTGADKVFAQLEALASAVGQHLRRRSVPSAH